MTKKEDVKFWLSINWGGRVTEETVLLAKTLAKAIFDDIEKRYLQLNGDQLKKLVQTGIIPPINHFVTEVTIEKLKRKWLE